MQQWSSYCLHQDDWNFSQNYHISLTLNVTGVGLDVSWVEILEGPLRKLLGSGWKQKFKATFQGKNLSKLK